MEKAKVLPRNEEIPTNILTPRPYQNELLDIALKENTIVCLGTGTGKTFIAVMLVRELAHAVRPALNAGGKRTVFLANTVPLVIQQAEVLRRSVELTVGHYVGEMGVDFWTKDIWEEELRKHNILVMTAQIFLDILLHGRFALSCVNLLIFDECHHAVSNHPYKRIMHTIDKCPLKEHPHILGLTACILNSSCKSSWDLENKIKSLELSLHCKAATTAFELPVEYGTCPEEVIYSCSSTADPTRLISKIKGHLLPVWHFLKGCHVITDEDDDEDDNTDPTKLPINALDECLHILEVLGPWCASSIAQTLIKHLRKMEERTFEDFELAILRLVTTSLQLVTVYVDEKFDKVSTVKDFFDYVTPKVVKLVDILRNFKPDDNNDEDKKLCGLVFVERRNDAYTLKQCLEKLCACDPALSFVHCNYVLGHGTTGMGNKESMMFHKQMEALNKFRMHECNLLISTSVLEEGVDVPKCNLVVRFDEPSNYRSYTQSKGRARAKKSLYAMLVIDSGLEYFKSEWNMFKTIDKALFDRCQSRKSLTKEEIENNPPEDILPAYMPIEKEGYARVTICSAISLLNRYCAKLPSDTFTHLTPRCKVKRVSSRAVDPMYIATLRLPINSTIKEEIQGVRPMERKRWAEMAAALKACELLHKAGELDDNLLPVSKEIVKYEDEEDMEEDEDDGDGQTQPGTTKRKQFFFKRPAAALIHSHPLPDEPSVLYHVCMVLTGPITDQPIMRGRKIYAPEDSPRGFGILLSKTLPQVPNFPVYTRSGEVTMSMTCVSKNIVVSAAEITRLHWFHKFVFSNVLHLEKDPMAFDPEKSSVNYILVPLMKDASDTHTIDWSFIEYVESYVPPWPEKQPTRDEFSFNKELFQDAVVVTSYRDTDEPQYFYVVEISQDLTPQSPFPSLALYKTFYEYYLVKYGLLIVNPSHPLLNVNHVSPRLNLLTPRYMNPKGGTLPTSHANSKRVQRETIQLIPELCDVQAFPASLWQKAICIPTILYRLNQLLVAEEMRALISSVTSIGMHELPNGFTFPKLDFGFETSQSTTLDSLPSDERYTHVAKKRRLETKCDSVYGTPGYASTTDPMANAAPIEHGSNGVIQTCDLLPKSSDKEKKSCDYDNEMPVIRFMKLSTLTVKKKVRRFNDKIWNLYSDEESDDDIPKSPAKDNVTMYAMDKDVIPLVQMDEDVDLNTYIGPSPCTILQALTMSNAKDFVSLERLETIGDSFLKYAITVYLYCSYPGIHEGKLSDLRSKQASNCNLYYLGKRKGLPEVMISSQFEPNENWLPPGYIVSDSKNKGSGVRVNVSHCGAKDEPWKRGCLLMPGTQTHNSNNDSNRCQIDTFNNETDFKTKTKIKAKTGSITDQNVEMSFENSEFSLDKPGEDEHHLFCDELEEVTRRADETGDIHPISSATLHQTMPYSLRTQHSIPDKSVADCVEAMIGCYLTSCGNRAALIFMSWLGLRVLPKRSKANESQDKTADLGKISDQFNNLTIPVSPLFVHVSNAEAICRHLTDGYSGFERKIGYTFQDKSYLLQAFTHASYNTNFVTDCYQRLEFLGDAVLDYMITRHLFEDSHKYSPGVLTDLRSALVNNNIFAALAVRWDFHKFFKLLSPALFSVVERFVKWQKDHNDRIDQFEEDDMEIPKALGDIFESVAGAIYLDSGMSLDTVWKVYYRIMKPEIDQYTKCMPKSPVRELMELKPVTAKFKKAELLPMGKIRVQVDVIGHGVYEGLGKNSRIAKISAAKKALKGIKAMQKQGHP